MIFNLSPKSRHCELFTLRLKYNTLVTHNHIIIQTFTIFYKIMVQLYKGLMQCGLTKPHCIIIIQTTDNNGNLAMFKYGSQYPLFEYSCFKQELHYQFITKSIKFRVPKLTPEHASVFPSDPSLIFYVIS